MTIDCNYDAVTTNIGNEIARQAAEREVVPVSKNSYSNLRMCSDYPIAELTLPQWSRLYTFRKLVTHPVKILILYET